MLDNKNELKEEIKNTNKIKENFDHQLILYNVKETSKILRISSSKLYDLVRNGRIECRDLGGRILFTKEDIKDFISKSKVCKFGQKSGSFKDRVDAYAKKGNLA